jgi:hypothetical protein
MKSGDCAAAVSLDRQVARAGAWRVKHDRRSEWETIIAMKI